MKSYVNGNGSHNGHHRDNHPDRGMMVDYVTGVCSLEERSVIEWHCINCRMCWTQLSTLLHLIVTSANEYEQRDMEALLPLGEQAAARARKIIREQEQWDRRGAFSWTSLGKRLQFLRPVLVPALLIVALLGGNVIAYFTLWGQSSEERALSRVREIYQNTRFLQARVTGGFAHRQYVATRGPGDHPEVDESKRVALLSELNQEVDAHQRAAARHNLGRLFMLRGELAPAEQQFLLALKERPRDARIMADLGALYYERSLKVGEEDRGLLEKAVEHTVHADFRTAETAGDEIKMRELVAEHFVPVQNLVMDQFFDQYLSAAIVGDKKQAEEYLRSLRRIGRLIGEIKGDRFVGDAVDFVARGSLAVKKEVQSIRQTLQQAKQEHTRGNTGAASELYAKARNAAERIEDHSDAEMAALGLARYYHHKDESKGIVTLRNNLVTDSKRRRHLQLHSKALLALANADGAAQRLSLNLEHSRQAAKIAKELGDAETEINGLRFVGYAYASLGDYDSAVKWLAEASSLPRDSWV